MFDFHKVKVETCNVKKVDSTEFKNKYNANEYFYHSFGYENRLVKKHSDCFKMKIKQNIFGIYTIPVFYNHQYYNFIIDTGASISGLLSKHIQTNLPLIGNLPIQSAAGSIENVDVVEGTRMFIGSVEIIRQPLARLSEDDFTIFKSKKQLFNFDGIIGWDILKELDFEIDHFHLTFALLNDHPKTKIKNLINSSIACAVLKDEQDDEVLLGIDSGARVCWFNTSYIKEEKKYVKKNKKAVSLGVLGFERSSISIIKKLEFYLYNKKISLYNTRTGLTNVNADLILDGILGNEIFEEKAIRFYNSKEFVEISEVKK